MRCLILFMTLTVTAAAQDAWREAGGYASFTPVSPSALADGVINSARVPMSGSALNIGIESNYLLPVTPDAALTIIRNVSANPVETDIPLSRPAAPDDFKTLTVSDSSLKNPKGLNLAAAEKPQLTAADADTAWRSLLLTRADAYQNGGLLKAEPYDNKFQPAPELVTLLKQRAPVLQRFVKIMDEIMTARPAADGQPPVYYWADEKIQSSQNLALGAVHARKTETGWQLADFTYYSASSYFISITLYEFWQVTVSGREQTYVWRGDYVISPSIGHAKGIERMAAENIMLLEVKSAIRAQINQCAGTR